MNRVFVIADTHFGHENILKDLRPFKNIAEHDQDLVRRWNSVVGKKDTVWHLGDVLFRAMAFNVLYQLNGVKRLVLGNHDTYPAIRYLEHFNSIHGCAEVRGCILTHIPVHEDQFSRYRKNIHGHLHSNRLPDDRYVCVSVEQTNFYPVLLSDLI